MRVTMAKNLVIVESPSKAKTLTNYLGKEYKVVASKGHIRDLPVRRLSIDLKHDFAPQYEIVEGKKDLVEQLQAEVADAKKVYLATDPDREGEAISWHLAYLLGLDLNEENRNFRRRKSATGMRQEVWLSTRSRQGVFLTGSSATSFPPSFRRR